MHAVLRVEWTDLGQLHTHDRLRAVTVSVDQMPERRSVRELAGMLSQLAFALSAARAEREVDRLVNETETVTNCLARAKAAEINEVRIKVDVLHARLEEILDPETPFEATTLALIESIVSDLGLLGARTPLAAPPAPLSTSSPQPSAGTTASPQDMNQTDREVR